MRTRDNLSKVCREWKTQQKILWTGVWEESGGGEDRFTIRGLLADGRCRQEVLDFLATTDVGKVVPIVGARGSKVPEWELWVRREREMA